MIRSVRRIGVPNISLYGNLWDSKKIGLPERHIKANNFNSGNSSVGRAQPCQGWGREFESRFPLQFSQFLICPGLTDCRRGRGIASMAGWQSGYAAACKAVDAGSIPASASIPFAPDYDKVISECV